MRKYEQIIIQEIIEEIGSTRKVRKALAIGQNILSTIKDKNGKKNFDRNEIVNEATKFFENLYKNETPKNTVEEVGSKEIPDETRTNEEMPHFLKEEIQQAIRQAKKGKATGSDNIKNEILKVLSPALALFMADLFRK